MLLKKIVKTPYDLSGTMPKNTSTPNIQSTLPEDDDEILDLLEVVKPGKGINSAQQMPSELESELDALLSDNNDSGTAPLAEQPFPDPTPVDHKVDAEESLQLPDMDDFDSLLASLGVKEDNTPTTKTTPDKKEPLVEDDLDALPIQLEKAGEPNPQIPVVNKSKIMENLQKAINMAEEKPEEDNKTTSNGITAQEIATDVLPLDDFGIEEQLAKNNQNMAPDLGNSSKNDSPITENEQNFSVQENTASQSAKNNGEIPLDDPFEEASLLAMKKNTGEQLSESSNNTQISAKQMTSDIVKPTSIETPENQLKETPQTQQQDLMPSIDIDELLAKKAAEAKQPPLDIDAMLEAEKSTETKMPEQAQTLVEDNVIKEDNIRQQEGASPTSDTTTTEIKPDSKELPGMSQDPEDGLNLQELDALLDDVLAAAPASGTSCISSTSGLAQEVNVPTEDTAIQSPQPENATPANINESVTPAQPQEYKPENLQAEISAMRDALQAMSAQINQLAHAHQEPAGTIIHEQPLPIQQENSVINEEILAELATQKEKINKIETDFEELQANFSMLSGNIDKLVAEAAVKVIREEILELVKTL